MKESKHLGPWRLLPPPPDTCQVCATEHAPEKPHNQQSLYYQYAFYDEHGRWPTWADAMRHCPPRTRDLWISQLAQHGVEVTELWDD